LNRRRLALILFVPTVIIVLAVGLTRGTNKDTEEEGDPADDRELLSVTGDDAVAQGFLQPAGDVIQVEEGTDCKATTGDTTPTCQAYQVRDTEVGWLVEQEGTSPATASFIQRTSPTEWKRVLRSREGTFETINVRLDDLTGDGAIESVFAFHQGRNIAIDVVDSTGIVIWHLDAGDGQVAVLDGGLTVWQREGEGWRKRELKLDGVNAEVVSEALVDGPAQGNV
jgi:hypothetical protein